MMEIAARGSRGQAMGVKLTLSDAIVDRPKDDAQKLGG